MSKVATVKEAVKETLVGVEEHAELSAKNRASFHKHAQKDPQTGEVYMTEEAFVDAIAPPDEDYVSVPAYLTSRLLRGAQMSTHALMENQLLTLGRHDYRAKSSVSSMASSSVSPIANPLAKSASPTGPPSTTCCPRPTPSTRSPSAYSTSTAPAVSSTRTSAACAS